MGVRPLLRYLSQRGFFIYPPFLYRAGVAGPVFPFGKSVYTAGMGSGSETALRFTAIFAIVISIVFAGCASGSLEMDYPTARILSFSVETVSFDAITLVAQVEVNNPNRTGIDFNGYHYRFTAAGAEFASDSIDSELTVPARDRLVFDVSVTLDYPEIVALSNSVELEVGLSFLVPLLGTVYLDVGSEQEVPIFRRPLFRITAIRADEVSAAEAWVTLLLEVENPNQHDLVVEGLSAILSVEDDYWSILSVPRGPRIPPGGHETLALSARIDMAALGPGAYRLLSDRRLITVGIDGMVDVSVDDPLFAGGSIPVETEAEIRVRK